MEFWGRLEAARNGLRRTAGASAAVAGALVFPALLIFAWLLVGQAAWDRPSPWPLVALGAALAAAAGLVTHGIRSWVRPLDANSVAAAAERARGLPDGSVRGALELRDGTPAGTSSALAGLAERRLVERAGVATPRELAGGLADAAGRRLRRLGAAAAVLVLAVSVLGAANPSRARAAWAPLLTPLRALVPPALPALRVSPGDVSVARGDSLAVSVEAVGRRTVTLHWRAQGELPGRARLPLDADRAAGSIGTIEAPTEYWVTAPDGAASDTFRVTPVDPLLLAALTVDVQYPAYLGRSADRFEGEPPPLVLPEGSVIRLRGEATRPLGAAALRGPAGPSPLAIEGAFFEGRLRPARSGAWIWELTDRDGQPSPAPPPALQVALVPDEAPWVEIRFPGEDTEVGQDMIQAVVAHAGDDHGLRRAALVSWRVDAAGQRDSLVRQPLMLEGAPSAASLRGVLRASGRRLVPGSRIEYYVEVTDNGPRGQTARSATFAFRFPSPAELRDRVGEEADSLLAGADDLSRTASELERATRELQRQLDAGDSREAGRSGSAQDAADPNSRAPLDFERAEDAREVLDRQEELLDEADALRAQMEELSEMSRSAGLSDPEFQERLEEIRDLMDEVATQEMREQLERLREALEALDGERTREALEALAEQQEELQQRMEQSLDLLRRAAAEQEMRSLADEARKIAAQQQALSDAMRDGEPPPPAPADASGTPPPADSSAAADRRPPPGATPPEGATPPPGSEPRPGDQPRAGEEPRAGEDQGADPRSDTRPGDPREGESGGEPDAASAEGTEAGQEAGSRAGEPAASEAGRQQDLARQAGELSDKFDGLQERLRQLGEPSASEQSGDAGNEARSGGESMQDAAEQARSGRRSEASESGREGAESLDRAADMLDAARESMTESWRDDTAQALEQATQDALSLAERESELLQQMQEARESGNSASEEQMGEMRGEQAAVQEGLESISRNLSEAASRSAMVDRQVGEALGEAMRNVQESASAMEGGDGRPRLPIQETQAAVDAMNQLAMSLLQNSQQVGQSSAGTGLEQALQQLAEAAAQQGRVNNEASALSPEDLSAAVLSQQARRLSERQQAIAQQLEGAGETLGGSEDVLGDVEALAEEAERLARELAGGRLDRSVIERQEQLFHRMLDAGRSLERDELGDERTAAAAGAFERVDPGALDPALERAGPRYPAPPAALLQRLSPAYRRLILDYFDLINRQADTGREAAGDDR